MQSCPWSAGRLGFFFCLAFTTAASAATTLRVVTYNVNLDTGWGGSGQMPGMETVLQEIGQAPLNDDGTSHSQPLDVLALQELALPSGHTASPSLQTIVNQLNAYYGAGTYAYVSAYDPVDAGTTGNGPSGLIYNTKTVQVISAAPLGTASGSGAPRDPMQYLLQPVGYDSSADFYVDVSHMKSGTDSTSASRRNVEATTLANNIASLPSNTHLIALGDFNITNGSSEPTYKTLRTALSDVGNPAGNWDDTSSTGRKQIVGLLSDSATGVRYRDDMQLMTTATLSGSSSPGLQYDQGSLMVFGNGGSASLIGNSVNSSSNSNVFPWLSASERSSTLFALTEASDHLPVVADYDVVGIAPIGVPEPATLLCMMGFLPIMLIRTRRRVTGAAH